jgi:hypothetical protein
MRKASWMKVGGRPLMGLQQSFGTEAGWHNSIQCTIDCRQRRR